MIDNEHKINQFLHLKKVILTSCSYEIAILLYLTVQLIEPNFFEENVSLYILWGIMTLYSQILVFLNYKQLFLQAMPILEQIQFIGRSTFYTFHLFILQELDYYSHIFCLFLLTLGLVQQLLESYNVKYLILYIIVGVILLIKFVMNSDYFEDKTRQLFLNLHFLLLVIAFSSIYYMRSYVINNLKEYNNFMCNKCQQQKQKFIQILSLFVPKMFTNNLITGQTHFDIQNQNTIILACNINNFETIQEQEKNILLILLDHIFTDIDQIVQHYQMQKIQTHSNLYICALELKQQQQDVDIIDCALAIMKIMSKYHLQDGTPITIGIGIDYGWIIGGSTSNYRPEVTFLGDTVIMALYLSKHNQQITFSVDAFNLFKSQNYHFQEQQIQRKGNGTIKTYQLIYNIPIRESVIIPKINYEPPKYSILQEIIQSELFNTCQVIELNKTKNQIIRQKEEQYTMARLTEPQGETEIVYQFGSLERKEFPISKNKNINNIEIYPNWLFKPKYFYAILLFLAIILFNMNTIYFILNMKQTDNEKLNQLIVILFINLTFMIISCIIFSYCYRDKCLMKSLIFSHILQGVFDIVQQQVYGSELDQIYIQCSQFSFLAINIYLRNISIISIIEIKILYLYELIYFIFSMTYNNVWNSIIIQLIAMEILYILNQITFNYLVNLNNLVYQQEKQQEKYHQQILPTLLPFHMLREFLSTQRSQTDIIDKATILIASIGGFHGIEKKQAIKSWNFLKKIFNKFDQCCIDFNLFKLNTICFNYYVMGVVDVDKGDREEEAFNVVQFAFYINEIIEQLRRENHFYDLNLRIAIHTGQVIGGIVGRDVIKYNIYGENVQILERLCQNGHDRNIIISEQTMKMIQNIDQRKYQYEEANQIEIYDKIIQGYFVDKKDNTSI